MYYDAEAGGMATSMSRPPPPFRVDVVTGCEAGASDSNASGPEAHPLSQLFFCDGCSRVVSRRDLAEDVDSYYCPNCLENMPSSEAMLYGMRCSKCWECPVCASTLTMSVAGQGSAEQSYYLACGYCRWSTRSRFEAPQPEQLIAQIIALEREGETRQRMSALVDAFRGRAQEQQRERELAQRLRRRSSFAHSSFAAGSLGAYAARRFSSAMLLRNPRLPSFSGKLQGMMPMDGTEDSIEGGAGPWRFDNLEAKLREQATSLRDLRANARALAKAGGNPIEEVGGGAGAFGMRGSLSPGKSRAAQGPADLPVLEGLTVEELVRVHTQPSAGSSVALLKEMQRSLEDDVDRGMEGIASLPQRLQQISYGYVCKQGSAMAAPTPKALRAATVQLEVPLQHLSTWALLPVRKVLLTKRSRRCRLLAVQGKGDAETKATAESTSPSASASVREEPRGAKQHCRTIIVKPQINPCSNPPFQKNNIALAFIPRCIPWMWSPGEGAAVPGKASRPGGLFPGEAAELVFTMANPLDTDVEVQLNPRAFNTAAAFAAEDAAHKAALRGAAPQAGAGADDAGLLSTFEQNVEVLTKSFETAISRFNDLADVHEVWGEETERMKTLKAQDDPDVIPDRKLHKILIRLRFRGLASSDDASLVAGGDPAPWIFFVRATFIFADASSSKHEVRLVLRFAADGAAGPVRGGTALLGETQGWRASLKTPDGHRFSSWDDSVIAGDAGDA